MRDTFDKPVDHVTFRGRRLISASWCCGSLFFSKNCRACRHKFLFGLCVKRLNRSAFLLSVAGNVLWWPLMMSLQHGRTWGWRGEGGGTCHCQFANAKNCRARLLTRARADNSQQKKRDLVHFWRRRLHDSHLHPLPTIHFFLFNGCVKNLRNLQKTILNRIEC